jgi:hypothetical protein
VRRARIRRADGAEQQDGEESVEDDYELRYISIHFGHGPFIDIYEPRGR